MYKMETLLEKRNKLEIKHKKYKTKLYSIEDELFDIDLNRAAAGADELILKKIGSHDDLAMCLVMFAWLSGQPYFKELTETDMKAHGTQLEDLKSNFIIDYEKL